MADEQEQQTLTVGIIEEPKINLAEAKQETIQQLDSVWRKQWWELNARNKQLTVRYNRIETTLFQRQLADSAILLRKEWDKATEQLQKPTQGEMQNFATVSLNDYASIQSDLEKILRRWEQWERLKFDNADNDPDFPQRIAMLMKKREKLERMYERLLMTDDAGLVLGLFPAEKKKNPALTHEKYLDRLSRLLKTPEDLAMFQRLFLWYTYDSPDPDRNALQKGTAAAHGDHWQTPGETLERTENGWMLGDCEDQAILLREIVRRWGEKPFVLYMTSHATCIWIRENEQGRYDAFDIGNAGLDKNGIRFGVAENNVAIAVSYLRGPTSTEKEFETPEKALESVLVKYRKFTWGLEGFDISRGMLITQDTADRKRNDHGTLEHKDNLFHIPMDRLHEHVRMQPAAAPLPPSENDD